MSKFFNETRSVRKPDSLPAPANVEIQDLVGSLEGAHGKATALRPCIPARLDLEHLLQPLQESNEVATQVAAVRLENCRSISCRGRKKDHFWCRNIIRQCRQRWKPTARCVPAW